MFNKAWERFKDLLRQCPHHGFSELHQLDTFYNALNPNDQDALDSVAGGNFLDKIPCECLSIIESKSKVRYSKSRVTNVRANANALLPSFSHLNSFDLQQSAASLEDKLEIRMNRFEKSLNKMKNSFITSTVPLKAVVKNLYNKPSSSSSLPSNTILNPKGEAKAITTRSGMSYKEPPIAPPSMDQQEPVEETTDTEFPCSDDIHPPTVQVEFRRGSYTYAEVRSNFKKLLNNKDKLIELTKTPLNENCSAVVLKKFQRNWVIQLRLPTLNDTKMVLELADRTISKPTGVAKNVFIKVGKFYFPADFVVLDFVADTRVPLILGRPFLRGIDFESEEIEDFLNDDSIPFGVEDSSFNMEEDIFFLEKSSTKNLIPIPNECIIVSENGSQSTEPINDNSSDFTIISNTLSDVESNFDESTSNHNTESKPRQEEIDVVSETNDVLPPSDDDSDDEVDVVDLHVNNVIQYSEHEYSERLSPDD
nr:hypothetical protein [Tanacetum cinerariifolium]